MRMVLGLVVMTVGASAGPLAPDGNYEPRIIEGWTVLIQRPLLDDQAALGRDALRLLEVKLVDVVRTVPAAACVELRKVPIYLCFREGSRGGPGAEYHPDEGWLRDNGYDPKKAKAVEIGDAAQFLKFSIPQPSVLLHELAHAYHDRVLGFGHAGIKAAYASAVEGRKYESVLHVGGARKRHYALTDEKEYFAEATEAWFGTNDFYPFVRAELREFDPQVCAVLREVWGS